MRSNLIFFLSVLLFTLGSRSVAQDGGTGDQKKTNNWGVWLAAEHEISRWEDISVVQVDNQLFVQSEKGGRAHLYTDKKQHCPSRATLLNRTRVFVEGCSKVFVADLSGNIRYKLRRFWFFEIAPNKMGTRFAIFERGRSAWHEFNDGSYDKLRLVVYSTEDGRKLFERKWKQAPDEPVIGAKIDLSDDGSTLYFHEDRTTTFFLDNAVH